MQVKYLPYVVIVFLGLLLTVQWGCNEDAMSRELEKRKGLEISIRESKEVVKTLKFQQALLKDSIEARDKEIADLRNRPPEIVTKYEIIRTKFLALPEHKRDSIFSDLVSKEVSSRQ